MVVFGDESTGLRSSDRRHRTALELGAALALTVIVHGAMFLSLNRQGAELPVIVDPFASVSVELFGQSNQTQSPPAAAPCAEQMLFDELKSNQPPVSAISTSAKPTTLSDLFGKPATPPAAQVKVPTGGLAKLGADGAMRAGDSRAQVSLPRQVTPGRDGTVAPCWRPAEPLVPVKVIIALDARGAVVGVPRIVRPPKMPVDSARLAAEAIAMRAMAGCAPYSLAYTAGRYRQIELDFNKNGNWERPAGIAEIR